MSLVNSNIRYLRKQKGLTQEGLANHIKVTRSVIGAYEEGRAEPKIKTMKRMADFFKISVDALVSLDLAEAAANHIRETERASGKPDLTGRKLRVLSITVDEADRENIELVPDKAAAGYLNGYADPEYVKDLPRFQLPFLNQGSYRAFEISGDSMLPVQPGSIIIGEYMENWESIKDGHCYVLVTGAEGIVYKRVFNRIDEEDALSLHSDNPAYLPYNVPVEDVVEVWKAKAFISMNFPDPEMSLQKLAGIVMDLQQEVIRMKG
ncbi:MAG TPA: helix-turn-helix domain-containing protein [Bacteroidetes bacterium]|nr:helix-turn-helix domain-containing protein [Bacteroidota bacterium]